MSWWLWLLLGWVVLSVPAAVLLGRAIARGHEGMPCRACEHGIQAHEHYRPGADCARCDCPQYVGPRRSE